MKTYAIAREMIESTTGPRNPLCACHSCQNPKIERSERIGWVAECDTCFEASGGGARDFFEPADTRAKARALAKAHDESVHGGAR